MSTSPAVFATSRIQCRASAVHSYSRSLVGADHQRALQAP
jgi:hypothetical protein